MREPLGGGSATEELTVRGTASGILILVYVLATNLLFVRASRFAKDQSRSLLRHEVWRASTYTDAGQSPRIAAIRFAIGGALVLAPVLWLLNR